MKNYRRENLLQILSKNCMYRTSNGKNNRSVVDKEA